MNIEQYLLLVFVCGMAGTTLMTTFVLVSHLLSAHQLNVLTILGTMLTRQTTKNGKVSTTSSALFAGVLGHYAVGFFFTAMYVWLWYNDIIAPTIIDASVLGFVTGIVGISVWRIYFKIHSRPPLVPLPIYLTIILVSHIFFGVGAVAAYYFLKPF